MPSAPDWGYRVRRSGIAFELAAKLLAGASAVDRHLRPGRGVLPPWTAPEPAILGRGERALQPRPVVCPSMRVRQRAPGERARGRRALQRADRRGPARDGQHGRGPPGVRLLREARRSLAGVSSPSGWPGAHERARAPIESGFPLFRLRRAVRIVFIDARVRGRALPSWRGWAGSGALRQGRTSGRRHQLRREGTRVRHVRSILAYRRTRPASTSTGRSRSRPCASPPHGRRCASTVSRRRSATPGRQHEANL